MTQIILVTGLSGAGRSVAAGALEDSGWFVIDNLPAALVSKVGELAMSGPSGYEKIVLVMGGYGEELTVEVEALRQTNFDVRTVFLEASTDVLVRRFESTKRRHPLADDRSLVDAIALERSELIPARAAADVVIDTTELNPHQLREQLGFHFEDIQDDGPSMRLTIMSFGFKHGLPMDVDMVLDCRFLPNPYWDDALRPLSGKDPEIQQYVIDRSASQKFLGHMDAMLTDLLPAYEEEGKTYLTIAFGCTGGRHRSVAVAEGMGKLLEDRGWQPRVSHRDIDR